MKTRACPVPKFELYEPVEPEAPPEPPPKVAAPSPTPPKPATRRRAAPRQIDSVMAKPKAAPKKRPLTAASPAIPPPPPPPPPASPPPPPPAVDNPPPAPAARARPKPKLAPPPVPAPAMQPQTLPEPAVQPRLDRELPSHPDDVPALPLPEGPVTSKLKRAVRKAVKPTAAARKTTSATARKTTKAASKIKRVTRLTTRQPKAAAPELPAVHQLPEVSDDEVAQASVDAAALAEAAAADQAAQASVEYQTEVVKKSGNRRTKLRLMIALLAVIIGLGWGGMKLFAMLNGPATGTIRKPAELPGQETAKPAAGISTLRGKYFELRYTDTLTNLSDTSKQNPGVLEQYQLMSQQPVGNDTLVVGIKNTPQGGLNEDSSYRLRQTQKDQYDEVKEIINKQEVYIIKRKDASEIVAFTMARGKLATVALRSTRAGADVNAELIKLMQTFQWLE